MSNEIKCEKCENITDKMHWIKRWVHTAAFGGEEIIGGKASEMPSDDIDAFLEFIRREMVKGLTEDVEKELHAGEQIVCDNCFKEM